MPELEIGFSSCPNDTFMFHGLMVGDVEIPGLSFRAYMADIEALNLRALGLLDGFEATQPPLPLTKETWNEGTRDVYAAMVERMDQGIGQVLEAIDHRGWTGKTLVGSVSGNSLELVPGRP